MNQAVEAKDGRRSVVSLLIVALFVLTLPLLLSACAGSDTTLQFRGTAYALERMDEDPTSSRSYVFRSVGGEQLEFVVDSFSGAQPGGRGPFTQSRQSFRMTVDGEAYEAKVDTGAGTVFVSFPDGTFADGKLDANGDVTGLYKPEQSADLYKEEMLRLAVDFHHVAVGRRAESSRSFNGGLFVAGLLLLVVGVAHIAFPQAMWWLRDGWKFRNAEPSELALTIGRIGGVVAVVVALVLLFSSCAA